MWMFLERYGRVLRIRRGRGCCEEWRDLTSTSATIRFHANEPSISPRKFSSRKSTPEIHIQIYICTYSLYLLFYFHTSLVKTHESNDAQKVPFRNASVIRQGKFRERDGGEKNIRTASDGFKVTGGSVDIFRERGGEYIYISIRRAGGAGAITSRCFCFSTRLLLSHYLSTTVRTFLPAHSGPHATFQPDTCCSESVYPSARIAPASLLYRSS